MTPENEQRLADMIASLDLLPDEECFVAANEMIDAFRERGIAAAAAKRGAVARELRKTYKLAEMGEMFDLTPQRIAQILDR